jgi:hypothetical protein
MGVAALSKGLDSNTTHSPCRMVKSPLLSNSNSHRKWKQKGTASLVTSYQ